MYLELGKVVGVWGVKGWVKLNSYTRERIDIAQYSKWWLGSNQNDLSPYEVLNCREQGRGIAAQLANVTDRDQAMQLMGKSIFVAQTDLPDLPKGEYYWHQLIGLTVTNLVGEELGKVASMLETGANDVLVVKGKYPSDVLIPYVDHVVNKIDLEQSQLVADWDPDYLIE